MATKLEKSINSMTVDEIRVRIDQTEAELAEIHRHERGVEDQLHLLQERLTDLTIPYKIGDIVEDETGTRYRVTSVSRGYKKGVTLMGIRLTVKGIEAHRDTRPIWSPKLRKV